MDEIDFEIVQPIASHAEVIKRWRNDPETLKNSLHTEPIKVWKMKERVQLFARVMGERVAHLRFEEALNPVDPKRKCCMVSINVAPEKRGKGIGVQSLIAIQPWLKSQGYDDMLALIRTENGVSQKVFEKAGFKKLDRIEYLVEDIDQKADIYRYFLSLTPKREERVFIIAEAGSNWCNWDMARRMIESAKEAGADAIKFQAFQEPIYVENAGCSDYLGVKESINDILNRVKLPHELIPKLYEECEKVGIEFMSSAFSPKDFAAIDPFVKRHKIASYEIGHIHLLKLARESKKPLLLSTGASTEFEIAWAIETFGRGDLTLLQCTACYPAALETLNLNALTWMRERFQLPVGLSDHSTDPLLAPIAAVALGAKVIEKHFTMDRSLPGPDHAFSVTAEELKGMVRAIRETEKMGGPLVKVIDPSELELRFYAKRGLQAIKEIEPGEWLREGDNFAILRPGKQQLGLHPRYLSEVEGKRAKVKKRAGEGIQKGDFC